MVSEVPGREARRICEAGAGLGGAAEMLVSVRAVMVGEDCTVLRVMLRAMASGSHLTAGDTDGRLLGTCQCTVRPGTHTMAAAVAVAAAAIIGLFKGCDTTRCLHFAIFTRHLGFGHFVQHGFGHPFSTGFGHSVRFIHRLLWYFMAQPYRANLTDHGAVVYLSSQPYRYLIS